MKTGVLISRDTALIAIAEKLLEGSCRIISFSNMGSGLDYIYSLIPDLLIIDLVVERRERGQYPQHAEGRPDLHPPARACGARRIDPAASLGFRPYRGLRLAVAAG